MNQTAKPDPTIAILFNDASAPDQVKEIVERQHAFVGFETFETDDEHGNLAYLLLVHCETATANELFDMIGNRLPDYVQARKFPLSRLRTLLAGSS